MLETITVNKLNKILKERGLNCSPYNSTDFKGWPVVGVLFTENGIFMFSDTENKYMDIATSENEITIFSDFYLDILSKEGNSLTDCYTSITEDITIFNPENCIVIIVIDEEEYKNTTVDTIFEAISEIMENIPKSPKITSYTKNSFKNSTNKLFKF